ncbi:MAG: glycosyltransferase family 4 protein [Cyanobacteriota bacterium]|nr:glycosyltransferase family 4 protein [Cyanobacteriota bacterium]
MNNSKPSSDAKASKYHFYLICLSVFGVKGGTEVYSVFLLQALQDLYEKASYDVFLKCEKPNPKNIRNLQFLPQTKFYYFGEPYYETNRWKRRWEYIAGGAKIVKSLIGQKPTVAIATALNTYCVVLDRLKRLTGMPYAIVVHGLEAWDTKNSSHKKALQNANKVIAVSNYTRDRILKEGYLEPEKVFVLPNTFDASQFEIKPKPDYLLKKYGLSPEEPVILTVTRLGKGFSEYKGYDKIIKALPKIRQSIPNVRYLLGGKGDDVSRIEALVKSLELEDCVTLAGFIPEEELADHYNLCDVFAMPSKGEGFGIVYLEAMASGKPVLGGNKDGTVDPLVNGELGCLVEPDDVEAIAENLTSILQGTYANEIMYQPEQLREKTIDLFGYDRFCQTVAELIENL